MPFQRWRTAPRGSNPRWANPSLLKLDERPVTESTMHALGALDVQTGDAEGAVSVEDHEPVSPGALPWSLIHCVCIDAGVDGENICPGLVGMAELIDVYTGLLIGLAYSVSMSAGLTMAVATW